MIDLAATFIDAGDATPLPHGKGHSFLNLVTGKSSDWHNLTVSEFFAQATDEELVAFIAEGRAAAAGVDHFLMGETQLPAPVLPSARPLM